MPWFELHLKDKDGGECVIDAADNSLSYMTIAEKFYFSKITVRN